MKKQMLVMLVCFVNAQFLFAQDLPLTVNGMLRIDSFYSDKSQLLIHYDVVRIDSANKSELIKNVKKWAGTRFTDLSKVLVSETDDQLVLNYVESSYYTKSFASKVFFDWFIKLVIQFKDGKFKMSYYDDGNVYQSPEKYTVPLSARSKHFIDYFKEKDGATIAAKQNMYGMIALYESILNTTASAKTSLEKKVEKKDDF